MNCHHIGLWRKEGGDERHTFVSRTESWTTTSGVALTIGSSGGGCRKMVMKMSVDELRSFGENNL
jgi:hypothetical protein